MARSRRSRETGLGDPEARPALRRETLAEQIARQIMESIASEGLRPGDALPSEAQLAAGFRVSQPVVREALRSLASLSVLEITNGRRASVKPLTPELLHTFVQWAISLEAATLLEVHQLRRGVESQSAALAAERITPAGEEELEGILARMRGALADPAAYGRLDLELHLAIARASGNLLMQLLLAAFRRPTHDVIEYGLQLMGGRPARFRRLQAGHEAIVAAIRAHDGAAARQAVERHLDGAMRRLLQESGPRTERAPRMKRAKRTEA